MSAQTPTKPPGGTPTGPASRPGPAARDDPETPPDGLLTRLQRLLHSRPILGPAAVLLVAVIAFSALQPDTFLRAGTLSLIVQQTAPVAVLALGQTLIILTAGIDLSVGAIMVLSMMVAAKVNVEMGLPGPLALLLAFAVGLAAGSLNGFLVVRLALPPFIVTLGTLSLFFATTLIYTRSASVRGTDMSEWLLWLGNAVEVGGTRLTYGSLFMVLLFVGFAYVLRNTPWGRHVYAVGDDVEAARLSGIRVRRVLFSVYAMAGLICGAAAWVLMGRINGADPQSGSDANLESITAVVLGGTSLFGGRGLVLGTLLGALVVSTFRIGLQLNRVDSQWQVFATGALVILAVTLDQWVRRLR
jgi:fructose transport system permease protein